MKDSLDGLWGERTLVKTTSQIRRSLGKAYLGLSEDDRSSSYQQTKRWTGR